MPVRKRHRLNSWLIVDEQTGFWEYSDNIVRQKWDQAVTHRRRAEQRHPQEFVYPLNDPIPVKHVRESARQGTGAYSSAFQSSYDTTLSKTTGADIGKAKA